MNKIFEFNKENAHNSEKRFAEVPKYGVETKSQAELDKLMDEVDLWGINVFLIDELSNHRPLTAMAFTIFQVNTPLLSLLLSFPI